MENTQPSSTFVQKRLPWIVAGAALLVFLATLNIWVNTRSMPIVAKVLAWDWTPPVGLPLFYILTLPFKIFPQAIAPIAMNVATALGAALVLGLLARSVALLPHDRTHEQRIRERNEFSLLSIKLNWLPVLMAVGVCGFQLTFWEHATAATNEILDLLIFAYCIRNLLEFRIDRRESWLIKLAFVYGLGVANNWSLIGFFPFFLGAIIWIKGKTFLNVTDISRLMIAGLLGLLLYFYLPIVWAVTQEGAAFGDVLKLSMVSQKNMLTASALRQPALVLSLTSLLPVIVMGIRWPGGFGETSEIGAKLANFMFRVVHLFFLGACLWVAFDQAFSPRKIGMGLPFLTFYYLGALAIGYYSGYALLTFTDLPRRAHMPPSSPIMKLLNPVIRVLVIAAAIVVPLALAAKNFPSVQASNGKLMRDFASLASADLPKAPAYLLSDDVFQTVLIRGYLAREGRASDYIFIDSRAMESPNYHAQMAKRHGNNWPKINERDFTPEELSLNLNKVAVQAFIARLATVSPVAYLHPSFGYYFERLYGSPRGFLYPLTQYSEGQILPPPLSEEAIKYNTEFWQKLADFNTRLATATRRDSPDAAFIALMSSRAMNTWGVFLQRANNTQAAEQVFAQATALNTNNLSAELNREFVRSLASKQPLSTATLDQYHERLAALGTWSDSLRSFGPFEEPVFCYRVGNVMLTEHLFRQGLQQLSRTIHYQPTNYLAHSVYIRGLVYGGSPVEAVKYIGSLREKFNDLPASNRLELINLESVAYFAQQDTNRAVQVLLEGEKLFPDAPILKEAKVDLYRSMGNYSNALVVLEEQIKTTRTNTLYKLQKAEVLTGLGKYDESIKSVDEVLRTEPSNLPALLYKAYVALQARKLVLAREAVERALRLDPENEQALIYMASIQIEDKKYEAAISALDMILDRSPDHVLALRNRAVAFLKSEKLDEAAVDFTHLQQLTPISHVPYFGLGEIAYKRKNTKEALKNYEQYLKLLENPSFIVTPELAAERDQIRQRVEQLKQS